MTDQTTQCTQCRSADVRPALLQLQTKLLMSALLPFKVYTRFGVPFKVHHTGESRAISSMVSNTHTYMV
jgi:hypothetical protein